MATPSTETANNQVYDFGIDDAFIVPIETPGTSTSAPVYSDKIYRLSIISKLSVKGNGKTTEKWASNKLFARVARTTQHELSFDEVGLPTIVADFMSGVQEKHGVNFGKTTPTTMPEFAFGYIAPQSDGTMNGFWYPRVSMDPATELSYETQNNELAINDTSLSMIANGLVSNNVLWTDYKAAREGAKDMTIEQFMSQVVYDETQLEDLIEPGESTVAVTGVSLSKTTADVEIGGTIQLTATVTPANATNGDLSWTSSDEESATVDSKGLVTVVTSEANKTVDISVTTVDGGKSAKCTITTTAKTEG